MKAEVVVVTVIVVVIVVVVVVSFSGLFSVSQQPQKHSQSIPPLIQSVWWEGHPE